MLLLQATRSGRKWGLLQRAESSPGSHRGLQPPWHLLERHTPSRFLQSSDPNFLAQVVESTKRGVLLDFVLRRSSWGCEGWGQALTAVNIRRWEFTVMWRSSRRLSRITTLDFRKAVLGFSKDLRIPEIRALEGREGKKTKERWLIFKHSLLQNQGWYISMSKK